ncbi:MAG: YegP family protein [Holophagales bacterium]|nr:YegP family protein [Holophagales bacterium]
MANHPKYEIFKGKNGKLYFHLTARNGQPVLASQGYADKGGCKNGIESVRKNSPNDANYETLEAKDGRKYFNLHAANKQVIGTSQMYKSAEGCKKGIESVKNNGPAAEVEDTTIA